MLRIFLGENQGEKLKCCAAEMSSLLKNGERVISIVPDQFSFAYDKSLYAELGARDFNNVTLLSFRRLSESLIDRFGTDSGSLISANERMIVLYLALKRVKEEKSLGFLKRLSEKPAFCADMSELIDSLRRGGISPEALSGAAGQLGGSLSQKLADVSKIYGAYLNLLSERSFRDESSVISEGARIALENSYFKGASVFVDRFDSFSPDELALLRAAVRDASSVTVSIAMPKTRRSSAISPFSHSETTQNMLINLAAEVNSPIRYLFCDAPKAASKLLLSVGECLYYPPREPVPAGDSLKILRADSIYEEAEYVAAAIRRLVTRKGFEFNDIAVITHDPESYSGPLEAAFERYGVSAFIDRPQTAAGMSLALFALDALDAAASRSMSTDRLMKYLRSPFSPLSQEEVSALWDYAVRWNVDGNMWLSPFTAGEEPRLSAAEAARQKAVGPILKLREESSGLTAKEAAASFCEFLNDIGLADRAYSVIENCSEDGLKLETARLFKQLWNVIMSAVTSVYLIAGDEKMTLRSFSELLRLILLQSSVARPPQKLQSVTVADVSRSVIDRPRAAFVVGLADGLFPADIKKTGLFSGRDIAELEAAGISIDASPKARLDSERFDCYKAMTAASERLYLSFSGSDLRGKELKPSRFILRIQRLCGLKIEPVSSLDPTDLCATPAAAYYSSAVSRSLSASEKAAVYEALKTVPEYLEKLSRLGERSSAHRLSPEISKQLFAKNDINVTASRIDVYNRCAFEYFCKYGLKLETIRPIAVDPTSRGTVLHFLFQSVLEYFGADFSEATDSEINDLIDRLLAEFSEKMLGGDFGKSSKFKADYLRLGKAASDILINMREEFKVSKFRPERFEYDLSSDGSGSVLSIPVGRGVKVNIRGVVDRIDTYTSPEGKRYIRVIDYKTGGKKFCFEDIYNGINLQLLLYMLALTEGRDPEFGGSVPSGVLYMNSGFLECKEFLTPETKDRLRLSAEQLKRDGLIVRDDDAIEAMDSSFSGRFVPVSRNKDGSYSKYSELISPKSFERLEEFAKSKVARFGRDLLDGRIDALPAGDDPDHLRCAYCEYTSVCDRKKYLMKLIEKSDAEKLRAEISVEGEADV